MKRLLIILLFAGILSACKKEKQSSDTPDLTPTPATTTGNLKGSVFHYNQFGNPYTSGLNTTTVTVEGKQFSAITDDQGKYTLSAVPSGTYTLVFNKPGCGLIKKQNTIYKSGDTASVNAELSDFPTFSISTAYAKDTSWYNGLLSGIFYNANTSPFNTKATVVAIIGKSANLNIANPSSYLNYASTSLADSLDFNRFQSYQLLQQSYSFKKDSTVYIKVYPVSTRASWYFDSKLQKPVYTSYGTPYPTVFTVTIP